MYYQFSTQDSRQMEMLKVDQKTGTPTTQEPLYSGLGSVILGIRSRIQHCGDDAGIDGIRRPGR